MKLNNLYEGLELLTKTNEAFYSSSQEITVNNTIYIIKSYSYRLASWSDFLLPFAKEARGTAFYSIKGSEDWYLFCRAYEKFFNLGEGIPLEDFIKSHKPVVSFEKLDGSLILFGMIENQVIAKSKTSINSEQAQMAQKIFDNNKEIQEVIKNKINLNNGFTPVFELIGPDNIIVLRYKKNELVFLGSVDFEKGIVEPANVYKTESYKHCANIYKHTWEELLEIKETSKPNIEGFVVLTDVGDFVKVKVNSYVELHHLKDSVNNLKYLSSLIISDNLDDIIGSFQGEQDTINYIVSMQEKIGHKYNHLVANTEKVFENLKELDRKDFAVKAKKDFNEIFPLLMNKYLKKDVNYKEYFMRRKMYKDIVD